jgi:S-DNA-T family DNA segregation ATPase FtsK/SpoIIIE
VSRVLRAHSESVAGLILAILGAVAALGVYAHAAGPVGDALDHGFGVALGGARLLVPLGLALAAYTLLSGRARGEAARVAIGLALAGVAAVGLLHLATGAPKWSAPEHVLRHAGGFVGAAVARPLRAAVGTLGAVLTLLAAGVAGFLLSLDVGPARAAHAIGAVGRGIGRGVAAVVHRFFPDAEQEPEPTPRVRATRNIEPPVDETPPIAEPPDIDLADEPEISVPVTQHVDPPAPPGPTEQLAIPLGPAAHPDQWKLPPISVLKSTTIKPVDPRLIEEGGRALQATLAEFGVDARLVGQTVGPTVTRYELELGPGVPVKKVMNLSHDLAYAMASAGDVRIALIPGRSAIGVEVPNRQRQLVSLGDILNSEDARRARHPLEVGLGRDIAGRPMLANLATMPHLLIAGATGAGKSSCINSLVTSVLMRSTPDQVRLLLVDPKRVELGVYNGLPHLLTEVVVNPKKAANALDWAVREMEMRYDLLAEVGVRDITGYNDAFDRGDLTAEPGQSQDAGKHYERLPFILIVVDELNDLMMVAARDVETSICRIAQMARAVGIHLVIATQRPSVDVITGVIKANIPSRLAFSVSSIADSRVILDAAGAEKLIGKGDMLLLTASSSRGQRVQGSWVDEGDVRKVVAHWRRQASEVRYVEGLADDGVSGSRSDADLDEDDDLLDEAMELVVRSALGSTSMLQRKLRVGFARAGRLMDLLERRGVVGPSEGSKARAVLMTVDELEARRQRA